MKFSVYYKEEEKKITVDVRDGKFKVNNGKKEEIFDVVFINNHTLSLIHNEKSILARVIEDDSSKIVLLGGEQFIFEEAQEKDTAFQPEEKTKVIENIIRSPMPGSVVKVNVKENDDVKEGDILVIVEAMKMENELRASGDMKVKKIYVKEGDQVEGFAPLMELE